MKRFTDSASKENLIRLKKKRKPLADLVNEQLSAPIPFQHGSTRYDDAGDLAAADTDATAGGVVEEYDWEDASHDVEAMSLPHPSAKGEPKRKRARSDEDSVQHGKEDRGMRGKSSSTHANESRGLLRRRGPLDSSLSQGKYDATPVDVESAMEDIFGALDMADLDAEGEEFYDEQNDDEDSGYEDGMGSEMDSDVDTKRQKKGKKDGSKKGKRAKDLTEEEYIEWLSKKQKEKRQARQRTGGFLSSSDAYGAGASGMYDGEEGAIMGQLESLRQNQLQLIQKNTAQSRDDAEDSGAHQSRTDEVEGAAQRGKRTGEAVKHFASLYTQLLHVRAKLQPAVNKAIGLPQYYARSLFLEGIAGDASKGCKKQCAAAITSQSDKVVENDSESTKVDRDAIREAYTDVCDEIRTIMALFFQIGDAKSVNAQKKASANTSNLRVPSFAQIHRRHQEITKQAKDCLTFWGDKFVQANSAKLKVIAQPLVKQIETILSSKSRLRLRIQKNTAHVAILGHPHHVRARLEPGTLTPSEADLVLEAKMRRAMAIAAGDLDEELYEDSDFLRELVRRGGATAHQLKQQLLDLTNASNLGKEPAKKGFHRLTKGKSVSYDPRPKIVGFLMAQGFEDSGRNDVVMKSLFQ